MNEVIIEQCIILSFLLVGFLMGGAWVRGGK